MPTAAAPRGSLNELLLMDETTYGTAPAGNWFKTLFYEDSLADPKPLTPDPIIGTARHNARDQTTPGPGLPEGIGGNLVVPLCLNHLFWWLKGALGAPSSSGSSDYTHTFTSGGEVLPHRSLERKTATSIYLLRTGCLTNTLAFDLSRKGGYDRVTVGMLGRKESKITSTGGGTPAALLAYDPIVAAIPVFKLDTVAVADVISLQATYDNKASPQDYIGDSEGYPPGHDIDEPATFTGSIRLRFRTAAMYDLAKANTAFAMELLWQRTSVRSLSLAAPVARMEAAGVPVTGPGRIEQTFNFQCEQGTAAAMLSAVLKNGTAAAAYAP